jgi:carotenoid cleavage dioxygenase-like enzyme
MNPSRIDSWNAAMGASPGALDLTIPASAIGGVVPMALRGGRMFSNGPGWTRIGDRTAHPFDGHGYMRSFTLLPDGG